MLSKNRYCHEYRRINNRGLGGLFSAKFVFEFPFGQTGLGNGKMVSQNNVDYSNLDNRYNPGSSSCTAFTLGTLPPCLAAASLSKANTDFATIQHNEVICSSDNH